MLKIGLAGTGHLGKIHAKCIKGISRVEFVGVFDIDNEASRQVADTHGIKSFNSLEEMYENVDIVDIVTPTTTHFEIASGAIQAGKHVFIEKPLTHSVKEGKELLRLQNEFKVKAAVGHVERYNPAFLALKDVAIKPGFIEGHRLAQFNPRGTDVSVVYDLMIHDLDIILKLVDSQVIDVRSKRVSILSDTDDICSTRIEFENGCVVNLTASRISLKNMRKLRLFQEDAYISIDFLERESQLVRLFDAEEDGPDVLDTPKGKKRLQIDLPKPPEVNAIQMELEEFIICAEEDKIPGVTLEDGLNALLLADRILRS